MWLHQLLSYHTSFLNFSFTWHLLSLFLYPFHTTKMAPKMTPFRIHPLASNKTFMISLLLLKLFLTSLIWQYAGSPTIFFLYPFYYLFNFLLSIRYGHFQENVIYLIISLKTLASTRLFFLESSSKSQI